MRNGKVLSDQGLHERMRLVRKRAGLKLSDVGKAIGISEGAVSRWESGSYPSREHLDAFVALTGVSKGWLLTGVHRSMDVPACAILSPERFYLICERREDGGMRVTCPEVPGLVLSHADPEVVMRDVIPAIDAIERHNRKRAVDQTTMHEVTAETTAD